MPLSSETTFRVRYAETDAMGVAHHASYIVWLEMGRTELLRSHGVSYREIEALGYFVVLSELNARYLASARYDDILLMRTELTLVRSRQFSFSYALQLAATGTRCLTAQSDHIVVAQATGRPARLPAELLQRLNPNE